MTFAGDSVPLYIAIAEASTGAVSGVRAFCPIDAFHTCAAAPHPMEPPHRRNHTLEVPTPEPSRKRSVFGVLFGV
jgi:hypothetical protein